MTGRHTPEPVETSFELHPRPPFRLDLSVWALRRRGRNRVDVWEGRYRRALVVDGESLAVEVVQDGPIETPAVTATVTAATALTPARLSATAALIERMLGVGTDLIPFYDLADTDPRLHRLKERFLGVKPPQFPTLFEALGNAVANQQLSLEVGIELINRFADAYGASSPGGRAPLHAFPDAATVATLEVPALRELGFSTAKARYLIGIARVIAAGEPDPVDLERMDRVDATHALEQLHGIGRWSAEYVLLRGLGRLDVYPGDDVGARNKLQRFFQLATPPTYPEIMAILAPWHPYAGMVYFHLLLHGLAERGVIEP
jgi:DNA-3-methyladenine glycosylase II